mgnify:CR=1 FL=1
MEGSATGHELTEWENKDATHHTRYCPKEECLFVEGEAHTYNIEKVIGGLKLSSQEVIDLKRDIVTARIDGMLCRAEKAGKLETARNMLEKGFSLDDIVDVTGLSEKDILNDD